MSGTRINEWFVPAFGPPKFRAFIGMMFLPYTGMCVSFAIIGTILVPDLHWDRVGAIALIYVLALGIGAHAADTIGSKKVKPWGSYFTRRQILVLMVSSIVAAYAIGMYYIVLYVPFLAIIAILEGFFLFAYNFEVWGGRFHQDIWFSISWGALPVMAGYLIQTDSMTMLPFAVAGLAGLVSFAEIKMSRPYKQLKKSGDNQLAASRLEKRLKLLSLSTIAFSLALVVSRLLI